MRRALFVAQTTAATSERIANALTESMVVGVGWRGRLSGVVGRKRLWRGTSTASRARCIHRQVLSWVLLDGANIANGGVTLINWKVRDNRRFWEVPLNKYKEVIYGVVVSWDKMETERLHYSIIVDS